MEIYREWLKKNNISFQEDEKEGILQFFYQELCFLLEVPECDRNWLRLALPNVYEVSVGKQEHILTVLNSINMERKCVKAVLFSNQVWLVVEMLIDSTPVIDDFFKRLLTMLFQARLMLYSKVL